MAIACGPNAFPKRASALEVGKDSTATVDDSRDLSTGQLFGSSSDVGGRILFVNDGNLWLWEKGASREIAIGNTWRQPRWSPDGSRIAFVHQGSNFSDLFVTDAAGSSQVRLTRSQSSILDDNDWNFQPAWSPDGRQIAFVSDTNSENPTLWVMNAADGTGRRGLPSPGLAQQAVDAIAWSPDGTALAVTLFSGTASSQIALLQVESATRQPARLLTNSIGGAMDPAWSPDGAWVAFAAREGQRTDVYLQRSDGSSGSRQLTTSGLARGPVWSPDGRHVAYLSAQTGTFELWVVDVEQGADEPVARSPRQLTRGLSVDASSGLSWSR